MQWLVEFSGKARTENLFTPVVAAGCAKGQMGFDPGDRT